MAEMRTCVGSARFGIKTHGAPIADFPKQPSQKDGLGRMCRSHWREYVKGLSRGAKASAAAAATAPEKVAKVRKAKALIDGIDALPGPEHVLAIASDEAQEALEVLSEHIVPAVDQAARRAIEAADEEAALA
ncbi:MAG: hypothetical protein ACRDMH_17460 [Solirubrobacterales bacterium]